MPSLLGQSAALRSCGVAALGAGASARPNGRTWQAGGIPRYCHNAPRPQNRMAPTPRGKLKQFTSHDSQSRESEKIMSATATQYPNYSPGLEGVIAGISTISDINSDKSSLEYRGYDVHDLAEQGSFEQTAYLLLHGKLPTKSELSDFKR